MAASSPLHPLNMVSKAAQAAAARRAASASRKDSDAWAAASATLHKVAQIADRKIESMEADSRLFTKDQLAVIPTFVVGELTVGKVLGKGGFGTVKEVRAITCKEGGGPAAASSDEDEEQALQDKQFIADHCLRETGDARYCLKVS